MSAGLGRSRLGFAGADDHQSGRQDNSRPITTPVVSNLRPAAVADAGGVERGEQE